MTTTLTREQLLNKAKARYEEVDVPGLGTVGIRSLDRAKIDLRSSTWFDDNGNLVEEKFALRNVYMIIDQVMIDESTPMFSAEDVSVVSALDGAMLNPLISAVQAFNNDGDSVKKKGE
jgi:hypothetical protein